MKSKLEVHPGVLVSLKGKGNAVRKYVYPDRTFQTENCDTSLIKIDKQIRKLLEFKYLKSNCHGSRHFLV